MPVYFAGIEFLLSSPAMEPVTSKLKRTRLFAHLPDKAIIGLVDRPGVTSGDIGDEVDARPGDLVVLLEGGLAMASDDGGQHLAAFAVDEGARDPAVLYTIPAGARLMLTKPSVYLVIDGERLDNVLSGRQEEKSLAALEDGVRRRAASLLKAQPFKQMSFEHLLLCAEAMQEREVSAGEEIVRQGEPGGTFYVLDAGTAEVMRTAAADGERERVAMLEAGATFGEEALLQEAPRNATVRMLEAGRMLELGKLDFDRLLKSELLKEVAPEEARRRLADKRTALIDCRVEEEWELGRLKNARLLPLDQIRERARGLDPHREYIVYCRTGRRSRAAAFLMRQAGLNAVALRGGMAQWPYELEDSQS